MILQKFSNILNIVIRRVENFLQDFEKHFTRKTCIFEHVSTQSAWEWISQKIQIFLRFLTYNSFDVSYDANSFSGVKIWSCQNNEGEKEYLESPQTFTFWQFDGSTSSLYFGGVWLIYITNFNPYFLTLWYILSACLVQKRNVFQPIHRS